MYEIRQARLAEWLKSKPSNQASPGSSPTRCKYLTDYNMIPSGKGKRNPRKITMKRILSIVIADARNRVCYLEKKKYIIFKKRYKEVALCLVQINIHTYISNIYVYKKIQIFIKQSSTIYWNYTFWEKFSLYQWIFWKNFGKNKKKSCFHYCFDKGRISLESYSFNKSLKIVL